MQRALASFLLLGCLDRSRADEQAVAAAAAAKVAPQVEGLQSTTLYDIDPPTQIHINQGDTNGLAMTITWVTKLVPTSDCQLRSNGRPVFTRSTKYWNDQDSYSPPLFPWYTYKSDIIHHCTVGTLQYDTTYQYRVGSPQGGYSSPLTFKTPPRPDPSSRVVVAVFADQGHSDNATALMNDILADTTIQAIILPGDVAYANSETTTWPALPAGAIGPWYWDVFFERLQPLYSKLPYMTLVGNHEKESTNYTKVAPYVAYQARLPMPNTNLAQNKLYYSFNYGPIHFVMLNQYMYDPVGKNSFDRGTAQYNFLVSDLQSVNRQITPWVVVSWHGGYYHTNLNHGMDLPNNTEAIATNHFFNEIEDVLYDNHVNLVLTGHVHNYERMASIYKNRTTPNAPTYIMVGTGGCQDAMAMVWRQPAYEWSRFRLDFPGITAQSVVGHGRLEVVNKTHMKWKWQTVSIAPVRYVDEAWITRNP